MPLSRLLGEPEAPASDRSSVTDAGMVLYRGRPERSLMLTGLRGVGKTVLLGEPRSMAMRLA